MNNVAHDGCAIYAWYTHQIFRGELSNACFDCLFFLDQVTNGLNIYEDFYNKKLFTHWFEPENNDFEPIPILANSSLHIWGVVTNILRTI